MISGQAGAVEQFVDACERDGIQVPPIAVDYASHSAQVEPLREQLLAELAGLAPRPARVPLYSTVHRRCRVMRWTPPSWTPTTGIATCGSRCVFMTGWPGCSAGGEHTFVELSPHPVLAPAITDTLARHAGRAGSVVITTLHRDRPDLDALATALGRLHIHGHSPSWRGLYPHARRWRCRPIPLSTAVIGWRPARPAMSALRGWALGASVVGCGDRVG